MRLKCEAMEASPKVCVGGISAADTYVFCVFKPECVLYSRVWSSAFALCCVQLP